MPGPSCWSFRRGRATTSDGRRRPYTLTTCGLLVRGAVGHQRALEIYAVELGVSQDRARQPRLRKVGTGEVGAGEIGAEQVGTRKVCAFQVGLAHDRVDEARILKVRTLQ